MSICLVCGSKKFHYAAYSEAIGIVEQHGLCPQCGYVVEQAYSDVCECFYDVRKGYRRYDGRYVKKNSRKHKRYRRRSKIKLPINPRWVYYT